MLEYLIVDSLKIKPRHKLEVLNISPYGTSFTQDKITTNVILKNEKQMIFTVY